MTHRLGRTAGVVAACGLAVGSLALVGVPTATAKTTTVNEKTIGFATGTIGDDGSFSATVNGTGNGGATSTVTVVGQLAAGTGIGSREAVGTAALSDGSFSTAFVTRQRTTSGPDGTGTVSGTVVPAPDTTVASQVSYNVTCSVTYPPLAITCSVVVKWSVPAT